MAHTRQIRVIVADPDPELVVTISTLLMSLDGIDVVAGASDGESLRREISVRAGDLMLVAPTFQEDSNLSSFRSHEFFGLALDSVLACFRAPASTMAEVLVHVKKLLSDGFEEVLTAPANIDHDP